MTRKQTDGGAAVVPTDDDPDKFDDFDFGCPNCGGEGYVYSCFEEFACIDPEGGCDLCMSRCDWCRPRKPADALLTARNDGGEE